MKGCQRVVVVEGLNLERFVCLAGEKNILLRRVRRQEGRRICACVDESRLEELAGIAQTGGWRMTAGSSRGAGALLNALRDRWRLAVATLLLGVAVLLGTRLIWRIEITGADSYAADIRDVLQQNGVGLLKPRSAVNVGELRDLLEWRYPRVAWFECGWRGTTLQIRAVEGILPELTTDGGPCDVIALQDGVVDHVVTCAGTPVVSPGQVVRQGQVLIRGEERTSGGALRPVAARGIVYARVWDTALVRMSVMETRTTYTGREQTMWTVRSPWFDLWPMEASGYLQEDTAVWELPLGGLFVPLVLHRETRMEAELTRTAADRAALEAEGKAAALQKLAQKAGGKDSLVDNWVNWSMINDEILLFAATGERIVDIAQQERDSGMAATE